MSILNFPERLEANVIDTGGSIVLGGYSISDETELQYITCLIFKHGTLAGSEQLRINVASDSDANRVIYSSDWVDLSTIPDIGVGDWLGWVRFDFARQGLATGVIRYLSLESNNYTRVGDTFYLGAIRDFPVPIYSTSATEYEHAAFAVSIFGYEEE